jgi:hypothetical protein
MSDGPEWFAPKRYGYGAGLPIRRQGWLILVGYFVSLAAACLLIPYTLIGFFSVVIMLTVAFVVITARTTRGGWHWRWGKED